MRLKLTRKQLKRNEPLGTSMSIRNLLKENKSLYQWARNQTFDKCKQDALDSKTIESILKNIKPPETVSEPIELISSTTYQKRQRGECDYCEKPVFKNNACEYHYTEICKGLKEYFGL